MMKLLKTFFLILATGCITGCSNDADLYVKSYPSLGVIEDNFMRSETEAFQIAQKSLSILNKDINGGNLHRASSYSKRIVGTTPITIGSMHTGNRRAAIAQSDTLLYVFNFSDNQGFAVVSADTRTEGLIAVTEAGHYNIGDTSIVGFNEYMKAALLYVQNAKDIKKSEPTRGQVEYYEVVDTSSTHIAPKIQVKWGQQHHEGEYCPNGISGCSNTAVAMIMSYYEIPTSIELTYLGGNTIRTLNWTGMKSYLNYMSCLCGPVYCSNEDHKSIGHLCRQLGYISGSNYGTGGTSTYFTNSCSAFTQNGFTISPIQSYYYRSGVSPFCYPLENDKLIFMIGTNAYGEGHAWVLDGCHGFHTHYQRYIIRHGNGNQFALPELDEEVYSTVWYNHINWGWNGMNNGYFSDVVFSAFGYALSYDGEYGDPSSLGWTYEEGTFNNNIRYITVTH